MTQKKFLVLILLGYYFHKKLSRSVETIKNGSKVDQKWKEDFKSQVFFLIESQLFVAP